jgi:hypothetical protein
MMEVIYYDLVGLNDEPLRKIANSFEEIYKWLAGRNC